MFREQFTSYARMDRDDLFIEVEYAEGPFKHLKNEWKFTDRAEGCLINFYVDFEFRYRLLQSAIEILFTVAVKRMVRAFEAWVDTFYTPKITS